MWPLLSSRMTKIETRGIYYRLEVITYINIYSTTFKHNHSHIVVNDDIQTCIQERTAYDDKHTDLHTRTYSV